jgi:dTDP-4-amino-4,6-dideoxygalactose transaminase
LIPFNKPYYSGKEQHYITKAMESKTLSGDLEMMRMCESILEKKYQFKKIFLTNSCTMALEMAAVLANIQAGDEVIMPSYTYVSTANAFVLRGANIVFADSKSDHPNMDETKVEKLITAKTKAIVVVHYAGVACEMTTIKALAAKHKILVIEDAAQCIDAFYNQQALGTIGDIACFSFHETKNIHCGEGGFIAINNPQLIARAEVIRNKGTNRSAFMKGEVNKYEWVDVGYSSIPSAISAAFLYAQLEHIHVVQKQRVMLWNLYYEKLKSLAATNRIQLPVIPNYASNNGHIFYFICATETERNDLIQYLKSKNIYAVFHYQSLHASPYYQSKHNGSKLPNSDKYTNCLVRLPFFFDLTLDELTYVSNSVIAFYLNEHVRN